MKVETQTWNGYESEKSTVMPPPHVMVRFCNAYKVTMDWLYRGVLKSEIDPVVAAAIGANHPELFRAKDAAAEAKDPASSQASGTLEPPTKLFVGRKSKTLPVLRSTKRSMNTKV